MSDHPTPDHSMPDPELTDAAAERIVTGAFAAFRETQRSAISPKNLDEVYAGATAQRRRRAYLSGLAAAAALALVVGTAALLSGVGTTDHTPSADDSPTVEVSASPSPSDDKPPRSPGEKPTKASPDAPRGIRAIDLRNATISVAALGDTGCAGGALTFEGGAANDDGCVWRIAHGSVRYANLDGVAGEEAVTTIGAGPPNSEYTDAVIALRATADGDIETLGYVYVADNSAQTIQAFSIGGSGAVTVQIRDTSWDPQQPQTQDRTFQWGGGGFAQIGGPTAFPSPDPSPSKPPEPSSSPSGA